MLDVNPAAETAALEGTWCNADRDSDGILRLTIQRDGRQLMIQLTSARHAAHDGGPVPALAYTIDVNPSVVVAFTATHRTARSQTILVGRAAPGAMTLDSYVHFTGDDPRADHVCHDVFVRG